MAPARKPHWSQALIEDLKDPAKHVISTSLAIVMRDKFPKARHHFLILPRANIASIYHVRRTTDAAPLGSTHSHNARRPSFAGDRRTPRAAGRHRPTRHQLHRTVRPAGRRLSARLPREAQYAAPPSALHLPRL